MNEALGPHQMNIREKERSTEDLWVPSVGVQALSLIVYGKVKNSPHIN